jgi:hypothetical protein
MAQETPAELKLRGKRDCILSDNAHYRLRGVHNEAVVDLEVLHREISETRERLQYPEQKSYMDAIRINSVRAVTSSVKRVPPEIMTKIFLYLTAGVVSLPPMKDDYPWFLGHVCSR